LHNYKFHRKKSAMITSHHQIYYCLFWF